MQLLVHGPGKATEDGQSIWDPTTHVRDLDEAPVSRLWFGAILVIVTILWVCHLSLPHSLSISFYNSVVYMNKIIKKYTQDGGSQCPSARDSKLTIPVLAPSGAHRLYLEQGKFLVYTQPWYIWNGLSLPIHWGYQERERHSLYAVWGRAAIYNSFLSIPIVAQLGKVFLDAFTGHWKEIRFLEGCLIEVCKHLSMIYWHTLKHDYMEWVLQHSWLGSL